MPTYKAPVEDVQFLLNDVFHIERYDNLPGFADASPDVRRGDPGRGRASSAEEVLAPLNRVGDWKAARATTMAASPRRTASRRPTSSSVDGGWIGLSVPPEYGGQGLPGDADAV